MLNNHKTFPKNESNKKRFVDRLMNTFTMSIYTFSRYCYCIIDFSLLLIKVKVKKNLSLSPLIARMSNKER